MPLQRDRKFMKKAIIDKTGRGLSKRTSNRPPTAAGSARASSTAARAPSGSHVSAWRKRRTRPCAARAPTFIWTARPRALTRAVTSGTRRAISMVPSRLSPSTTTISASGKRARRSGRSRSRFGASSRAGMMMLRGTGRVARTSAAPRRVVQAPVVVEVAEPGVLEPGQPGPEAGLRPGPDEGGHAPGRREVSGKPLEDRRDARGLAVASRLRPLGGIREKGGCLLVELRLEPRGLVGLGPEVRARERGAHKSEMHAGIPEDLAEDAVLDLVEGIGRAPDHADLLLPDG